jgi:phage baseplate assembly protein W
MTVPTEREFLGRGWGFPLGLDAAGEIATAADAEDVRQAVRLILATGRGERVMRPDFGAGLDQFVFAPLSAATLALIRHRVEEALIAWEPRIDVAGVRCIAHPGAPPRVDVAVEYRIRSTNTFYNLVYPFYLEEAGEA